MRHARNIICRFCKCDYHLSCITIAPDEINRIILNASDWLCEPCLAGVFPFNHIEDNNEYNDTLFNLFHTRSNMCSVSEKIFSPLDVNTEFNAHEFFNDIDPDVNFYDGIVQAIGDCKYYLEDMFNDDIIKNANRVTNTFSMIHLNIRSMKKNLSNFEAYLKLLEHKFRIVAISETWLQDANCNLYDLQGYDIFENHRTEKIGGGVAIFIDSKLVCKRRNDLDFFNPYCESLFLEIDKDIAQMNRNIIIGVIYRVPNSDVSYFLESINSVLTCIRKENKLCYLLGDYNLDLLHSEDHGNTGDFLDLLSSHSFLPLINRPTRVTPDSATIIDNIFTNNINTFDECMQGIFVTDISDHYPIFHLNFSYQNKNCDTFIIKRKYTSVNNQAFIDSLSNIDWKAVMSHDTTNGSFNCFHSILKELHNKHFPKSRVKLRYNNKKPWLSDDLKESIKLKNKLYYLSKKIPSVFNEENYKRNKYFLQRKIKSEEKKYYEQLFDKFNGNMKKSWNLIKSIINRGKKPKAQNKFSLSNGSVTCNKDVICDKFNGFFTGIGPTLANAIPSQSRSPESYMGPRLLNTIFLSMVTDEEIVKIVQDLKEGAPGYDDIPSSLIKMSLPYTTIPLAYICNMSLSEGVFPEVCKVANVVPLFKSGDPMMFSNYRPVSLLCVLSKVFEKVMYSRLNDFLTLHKLLYKYQFGFRKKHSAYMALMILVDKLTKCLENGDSVVGVYLDFSKAFDNVNQEILLSKLDYYGIRGTALLWFKSYLSDRTQFVTYDGVSSKSRTITCGVPQGSILGPLLFLIYINDLNLVSKDVMSIFFADDSNLFLNGKNLSVLEEKLNSILINISEWLKVNKLSLNVKKTHVMIFTKKKFSEIEKPKINLKIDGIPLSEVETTKFLGVIIDNKLSWKEHTNYISGKIAKGIGIILKARNVLNRKTLTTLYYSFVYPYFTYCNQVWGSCVSKYIKRIHVLQKKAVRVICQANPRTHVNPLFKELNLMDVWQINKYLIGLFMYKYYHKQLPAVFNSSFTRSSDVHMYSTRHSSMGYMLPKVKTNYGKANIHYRGPAIWNDIVRNNIFPDTTIGTFKYKLKAFLIEKGL